MPAGQFRAFVGVCFSVLILSSALAAQTTIHVPADQPTIQSAINTAVSGDLVLVSPGTYNERINFQGKNITVTSVAGAAQTIIDGQNAASVVTFSSGESNAAVLSGFTIQHGNSQYGGGIDISNGNPTIQYNVIANNGCGEGGGIDVNFSSPVIQYNTIHDNNRAANCYPAGVGGGGIAIRGVSTAKVLHNEIHGNLGGYDGGGIEMWAAGNALIEGNFIHDNYSQESQGGGMNIDNEGSSIVRDNVIVMNHGGGVYWGRMPGDFSNNTVAYNSNGSTSAELAAFSWWNGTFRNNLIVASSGGTAIQCESSTTYGITVANFTYNDMYGNGGTAYTCPDLTGTNHNLSADPLFADPANEDFHVATGSPVIGASDPATAPIPATDASGDPRVVNGVLDIGGYEYQGTTTLGVSPGGLTFSAQKTSTSSAAQSVTVTNTGATKLHFSPIQIGADFQQTNNCSGPNGLAVTSSCSIGVVFEPLSSGSLSESLIVSGANVSGNSTVTLIGQGTAPVASLSTNVLNFGNQSLFTTSAPLTVTLPNIGDASMIVSSVVATGDFAVAHNCSTLAPNASCTAAVTFTPTATRSRTGTLAFTDDAVGSPQQVTLTGTGIGPEISFSTAALNFLPQPVGTAAAPVFLTVTNTGGATLSISSIQVSGAFSESDNCSTPIPPSGSCQVSVVFLPSAYGSNLGTLLFTDNAAASPQSVGLSGAGQEPIGNLTPQTLYFPGPYVVGTQSGPQQIYYKNIGNGPLVFSNISVSGDFTQTNTCGAVLAPSTYCTISVSFVPTAPGNTSSGFLTITDNSLGSPHTASLSGTAVASYPVPSLSALSSGVLPIGASNALLTVVGTGFFPASTVQWDGQAIATTYVNSTTLTAAPPASLLTGYGEHSVTISNAAPGGGTSNSATVTLYLSVPYSAKDMVYDPYRRLFYASISSTDTTAPNSVLTIDPNTGAISTLNSSANIPDRLALSDDGQFLYVGIDGNYSVERWNLYTNQVDLTIPLGSNFFGSYFALDIKVLPGAPHSIAVAQGASGEPPEQGVVIYDDGQVRGAGTAPYEYVSTMTFGADSTVLYGTSSDVSPASLYKFSVGGTGLSLTSNQWNEGGPELHYLNGMLYSGTSVYNATTLAPAGSFALAPSNTYAFSIYPEPGTGLIYLLGNTYSNTAYQISSASTSTFAVTGSLQLPIIDGWLPSGARIQRWGRDGLGFIYYNAAVMAGTTPYQLCFLRSSITNPSTGNNPTPAIAGLSPQSVNVGSANLQLTVSGSNFVPDAVVQWNGNDRTTIFVSSTQLTAYISSADVGASGSATVTVINPAPAGGTSNGASFVISSASFTPVISWSMPTAIAYGTALSGAQLNATANVPGSFAYAPPPGTVLAVGTHTLSVTFTPIDTADYSTVVQTVSLTVNQATQTITFPNPGKQIYDEAPITLMAAATSGLPVSYAVTSGPATVSGSTLTITGIGSVTVQATQSGNANYAAATPVSDTFTVSQGTWPATGALFFVPITPCRVADTRNAAGPFGGPSIAGGTARSFAIPNSSCGVPSTAAAYAINVTVVPRAGLEYLTVWPTGVAQPWVSTLNSDVRVKANAAIVPAGISGLVNVYATDTTDLVLDISGYFVPATNPSALAFYPLTPCRVVDTRNATGALGGPSLVSMQPRVFPVLSSACKIPSSAQAYSLNFTAVPQAGLNYLSAWPAGQTWPGSSTLNGSPDNTVVANAAIVPAGTGGEINVLGSDNTDVIIDVNGYFAPPSSAAGGQALFTVTPCRVLDTRSSSGSFNGTLPVNVTSSPCGIPSSAEALVLNATVVPIGGLGYLTLWPESEAQPWVSTLNAEDGVIASNMAIVPTTNGSTDAFSSNSTQLILDISGYFAPYTTTSSDTRAVMMQGNTRTPGSGIGTITSSDGETSAAKAPVPAAAGVSVVLNPILDGDEDIDSK